MEMPVQQHIRQAIHDIVLGVLTSTFPFEGG